jgi:hypothetical protein
MGWKAAKVASALGKREEKLLVTGLSLVGACFSLLIVFGKVKCWFWSTCVPFLVLHGVYICSVKASRSISIVFCGFREERNKVN